MYIGLILYSSHVNLIDSFHLDSFGNGIPSRSSWSINYRWSWREGSPHFPFPFSLVHSIFVKSMIIWVKEHGSKSLHLLWISFFRFFSKSNLETNQWVKLSTLCGYSLEHVYIYAVYLHGCMLTWKSEFYSGFVNIKPSIYL